MTSCIKVIIYDHCQKLNILNEEQKGCVKECFGCKEQLIIDTVIMEQARKNNVISPGTHSLQYELDV
jgi:hypothetical protein